VRTFQQLRQQATAEEQRQASSNVAPNRQHASRDGVDEWFFDGPREGAKDAEVDSEADEAYFHMVTGSEIKTRPVTTRNTPAKLTNFINFKECDIADENVLEDGHAEDTDMRHSDRCSTEKQPQSESPDQLQGRLAEAGNEIDFLRKRVAQLEHFSMSNEKAPNCEHRPETNATDDEQDAKVHTSSPPVVDFDVKDLQKENVALRVQVAELNSLFQRMPAQRRCDEIVGKVDVKPLEIPEPPAKPSPFFSWSAFNPFATCRECHNAPSPRHKQNEYVSSMRYDELRRDACD
jgi:hypothetical protein